jgi:DNA helicase-2/ATP-dependent DNA helicase PcrA
VLQRFERRRQVRLSQLRAEPRLDGFCDDVVALGKAIEDGATTAEVLVRVRDQVGLGAALATLDLSGKGPDASHRDDLNALIAVATFEPDPSNFEPWLRARLRNRDERAKGEGVAVSTVHRVKGMEWPYVVVLGAHDGLMPHALADDLEEERRIFHVAITRGDAAVHVIADAKAPAPFLDQLHQLRPAGYRAAERKLEPKKEPPAPTGPLAATIDALKKWRKQRATADRVPAYVVLSDTHLAGIASAAPATLDDLARCAGIGPTKLERYGDEILAVITDTQ